MGYLTTHILDTTHGIPATGVSITLYEYINETKVELSKTVTNSDGRCDTPVLPVDRFHQGVFELEFAIGNYFRTQGLPCEDTLFLDNIVIRFGISDDRHYHVPVLVSPYGYSTYRGS